MPDVDIDGLVSQSVLRLAGRVETMAVPRPLLQLYREKYDERAPVYPFDDMLGVQLLP
jgi:hypothetical protein